MAKCTACGKFLSPSGAATCTTCPGMYHRGCVGFSDNTKPSSDWSCPECKKKCRKGDNSSTPMKGLNDCTTASLVPLLPHAAVPAADQDVKEMRRELAEYMSEFRAFRHEFLQSLSKIGERMDGLERRLTIVEQRETAAAAQDTAEVLELQQTVDQLKRELNDRDQEALLSDLDIGQLPEEKGENPAHVVAVLAAKLGVKLEERDIMFAERVGASERSAAGDGAGGRPRRLVVRLSRRHLRDELLRAARVRRNLSSTDMGLPGPPRRVYINERLTRANRLLFYQAREECRQRQWRYCWTRRGRICVRQADGKQVYQLRSVTDLKQVFKSDTV